MSIHVASFIIINIIFQSIKKRMLDVANSLGLSQTVMKLVERRSATDQYIFYMGMVVTLLIMFLLLYYVL